MIRPTSFSEDYIKVFSLYPGPGRHINRGHYKRINLSSSGLYFPLANGAEKAVELVGVHKGDAGCAVLPNELKVGMFCSAVIADLPSRHSLVAAP